VKKVLLGLILGIVIALSITAFAASYTALSATFEIYVNGEKYQGEDEPVVINGRTYLPVRALSEAMGVPINWNGELRRVEMGVVAQDVDASEYISAGMYKVGQDIPAGE